MHPKEDRTYGRREFLRRAAVAGVAVPSLAAILDACGGSAQSTVNNGGGSSVSGGANPYGSGGIPGAAYPLARLDAPVTWTIQSDNPVIGSGMKPETNATLQIYNWHYYLSPALINSFKQKYNCNVKVTLFDGMDPAVTRITAGQNEFDLLFGMQIFVIGKLIAGGFIRPINQDYIPNLKANVWDSLQSPFYDVGSRFSVPYSVWNTGIFWRNDMVTQNISKMSNPYDIFWHGAPKNKTAILENSRDALSLAMFWRGETDVNTTDPKVISQAQDDIQTVVSQSNARFDHTDYTDLPSGKTWLHQSWSGNVGSAFYFLKAGDTAPNLSYYWPGSTSGIPGNVDNDTILISKSGKNPVLAHLFMDWVLQSDNALKNYTTYTGYQMPIKSITASSLVGSQVVPAHLATTVVTEEQFTKGYRNLELDPQTQTLWDNAYQAVSGG
jgi:spermidine/putrescine transport system substrate-binding protein